MSDQQNIPSNVLLEVIDGSENGLLYTIVNKTITIGRHKNCDVCLKDEFVSNKHCQIVFRGGHFTIIDLGSMNKTKVSEKAYIQKNLKNKDIITLGKTKIVFHWNDQDITLINPLEDIFLDEVNSEAKEL